MPVQEIPGLGPQHRRVGPAAGPFLLDQIVQIPHRLAEPAPVVVEPDVRAAVVQFQREPEEE